MFVTRMLHYNGLYPLYTFRVILNIYRLCFSNKKQHRKLSQWQRTRAYRAEKATTRKNVYQQSHIRRVIFWDITPCSSLKVNRRFGGSRSKNKPSKKPAWSCLLPASCSFLAWLTANGLHGVISQKIEFLTVAVRISRSTITHSFVSIQ
jgi:hypothetical protein